MNKGTTLKIIKMLQSLLSIARINQVVFKSQMKKIMIEAAMELIKRLHLYPKIKNLSFIRKNTCLLLMSLLRPATNLLEGRRGKSAFLLIILRKSTTKKMRLSNTFRI
jgi:hypothetical protein